MHITTLDWIFLVGYLLFCAGIGIVVGLRVKDTDHYFLGKRRFGKWLMMGQSFGIGTHAEMPVSLAGAVYSVGASGIWCPAGDLGHHGGDDEGPEHDAQKQDSDHSQALENLDHE